MILQRSAISVVRRVAVAPILRRSLATTVVRRDADPPAKDPQEAKVPEKPKPNYKTLSEIRSFDDLIGPGAAPGTVPTDLEQATGLERLEILAKMEGVDLFDMRPLDASRKGTLDNPIMVNSAGNEQYAGCTGYPADSHVVSWITLSRDRPIGRCMECGGVYKMNYIGPEHDDHHGHHGYVEPKTMGDYVKPEYWWN